MVANTRICTKTAASQSGKLAGEGGSDLCRAYSNCSLLQASGMPIIDFTVRNWLSRQLGDLTCIFKTS